MEGCPPLNIFIRTRRREAFQLCIEVCRISSIWRVDLQFNISIDIRQRETFVSEVIVVMRCMCKEG